VKAYLPIWQVNDIDSQPDCQNGRLLPQTAKMADAIECNCQNGRLAKSVPNYSQQILCQKNFFSQNFD
jgi:hypothetical protein